MGSSLTRNQNSVPCIARQILNHRPTRESPLATLALIKDKVSSLPALGSLNTPLLPVAFAKESYFGASVMACPGFEDSMSCWGSAGSVMGRQPDPWDRE